MPCPNLTEPSLGAGSGICVMVTLVSIKTTHPHRSRSSLLLIPHSPERRATFNKVWHQSQHLAEVATVASMLIRRDVQGLLPEPLSQLCVGVDLNIIPLIRKYGQIRQQLLFASFPMYVHVHYSSRIYTRLTSSNKVILYYDYLLTLPDEITFFWRRKRSSVSILFFLNRYLPMASNVLVFFMNFGSWSQEVNSAFWPTRSQRHTIELIIVTEVWCSVRPQASC